MPFNNVLSSLVCRIGKKALIEADLDRIDQLLVKLEDKLEQYKFGLPTLLIATEQGIYAATKCKIDQLCLKVKNDLGSFNAATTDNHPQSMLSSNIGAHLANRLTEEYEKFQMFQKMFASILYERRFKKAAGKDSGEVYGSEVSADSGPVPAIPDSGMSGPQQTQYTVVLDEAQESMLEERTHEISTILADTLHLNDLLHQIQVMTVQQGSLLDRIDVNLDLTRGNLKVTIGGLERTAESFSAHQKRLILFFIALAIFAVSLLIFCK